MLDIVATIQAEQDEIIRAPLDLLIAVQGGPGTGKTAVGLHRAAFLLYNHPALSRAGVLVIGPSRAFLRYIAQVLPSLGEEAVIQTTIADLAPRARAAGEDPHDVRRLKGDPRMAEVLAAAPAAPSPPRRRRRDPARPVRQLRGAGRRAQRAGRLHRRHPGALQGRTGGAAVEADQPGPPAAPGVGPVRGQRTVAGARGVGQRCLPQPARSAVAVGVPDRSGARPPDQRGPAAGRGRRPAERSRAGPPPPARRAGGPDSGWTADDLPLLDEADALINGRSRSYGHIVVDEAQDLSPMQFRMLARRAPTGSLTVLGDLAQATGAWTYESWDEILHHLPTQAAVRRDELTLGYRAPGQVLELASRLLPVAAPTVKPTRSIRPGRRDPASRGSTPTCSSPRACDEAGRLADEELLVGLVVAPGHLAGDDRRGRRAGATSACLDRDGIARAHHPGRRAGGEGAGVRRRGRGRTGGHRRIRRPRSAAALCRHDPADPSPQHRPRRAPPAGPAGREPRRWRPR